VTRRSLDFSSVKRPFLAHPGGHMTLTVRIDRLPDGRLKGFFEELPGIFYTSSDENALHERLDRLAHALSSPHVKIRSISADGDVVLELAREGEEEAAKEPTSFLTLTEACFMAKNQQSFSLACA
jgi:hypothetical protein